ncbi:hypothetical protein [Pseudoalteromonas tunicata]|jgi:hypothetical protein|uniref:Uncharacterized protein n=1 Tax=Pseudoalteromonas tunicata D2 TaxID=87626 RepID=A4C9W7_9GAMM|nr:hypothetical protein [Pseudoalteromonas tunicata]AXT30432.1 hypothetical protein D1819_06105 [Pseudoalteromonas tunicata]EAR28175.1 hypothetical protein PTD2_20207 [Pseudoalteromonas tunicata D2]
MLEITNSPTTNIYVICPCIAFVNALGNSQRTNRVKKLFKSNRHVMQILTGQDKLKNIALFTYIPGSKDGVAAYLHSRGKNV